MRRIVLLTGAIALAGCASGGPVQMSPGVYLLTKKSAGCGFTGGEGSKVALLKEAGAFCAQQGKQVDTLSADAQHGVPFARCASAEVRFRCVP